MTEPRPADELGQLIFGRNRVTCIQNRICIQCGERAEKFVDALSAKEFTISALCQKCQDEFFGADE